MHTHACTHAQVGCARRFHIYLSYCTSYRVRVAFEVGEKQLRMPTDLVFLVRTACHICTGTRYSLPHLHRDCRHSKAT